MKDTEKRELVERLAVNVMGWQIVTMRSVIDGDEPHDTRVIAWWDGERLNARFYIAGRCERTIQFDPTERIERAWLLVEALRAKEWDFNLQAAAGDSEWLAAFHTVTDALTFPRHSGRADAAPLAICFAADDAAIQESR